MQLTPKRARLASVLALVLLAGLVGPVARAGTDIGRTDPPQAVVRRTEPGYKVQAGIDGEVFPVLANFASFQQARDRKLGVVSVTITNTSDSPLRNRVAVQIPGWSDQEIQVAEMAAGEVRTLLFAPTFLPRLYENREIVAATARITVSDFGGRTIHEQTLPVRLRSAEDMYWGSGFRYAQFIASWVTPHDGRVEEVLSRAKELMPGRRLPGYETWKPLQIQEQSTYQQLRAIYRALQQQGVSYVKSSLTLGSNAGSAERVRMPRESLRRAAANCIDGAVLYASLFENLGMDPLVVLVPGHAYVGIRLAEGSKNFLYIETSLTGRASFQSAVDSAQKSLAKYPPASVTRIDVGDARRAGVYPMPAAGGMERQPAIAVKNLR